MHPQHLAATVLKAIAERNNLNTADVDDIIWSTSTQRGKQGGDLGRMAALDAGYDIKASGMTLDRFCGGGITAVNFAAAQIMSGMEDLVIAGGTEMMSLTGAMAAEDMAAGKPPLGMGSGNKRLAQGASAVAPGRLRRRHRRDGRHHAARRSTRSALESQRRAAVAIKEGRFDKSIVPVMDDDGNVVLDQEEYPASRRPPPKASPA